MSASDEHRKAEGMTSISQFLYPYDPAVGLTLSVADEPMRVLEFTHYAAPVQYMRSEHAVLPDPTWEHTDAAGHDHRWDLDRPDDASTDDKLPTLTSSTRHVECDGSCGGVCEGSGYDTTVWHCRSCGEQVEPEYLPDYQARTTGIPYRLGVDRLELDVEAAPAVLATTNTAILSTGGRSLSGKAHLREVSHDTTWGYKCRVEFEPDRVG